MPLSPAKQALSLVDDLYKRLSARRPEIALYDRYFRGVHPLTFASPEWQKVHRDRYQGFSDNWCGVVGSAPGERTELFGFRLGDDTDVVSDDEKVLWRDWEVNEGPAQSSQGFLTSTISKRSAVLVWGDENDEPVMTWEHPSQVIVDYHPGTRRRRAALKAWVEDDIECATLYTADTVWKFQRATVTGYLAGGTTPSGLVVTGTAAAFAGGGWVPRQDGDEPWPLANPLGRVPIVEFPNRPILGGEPLSDIAGTTSMQDAVNLLWAYLFAKADFASMPARVVMGQEPPKIPILDENGQKVGEKPVDIEALTNGRLLWLTGQNTSIGQWEASALNVFTDVINISVRHIAAQTRTPIYLVHGELGNVNGETLTGLDAPLVSKVRESHKFFTSPIREVFSLMALVRGDQKVSEACRVGNVQWKNPEVRSDAQISDAALKDTQIGWPFAAVLEKRYGMSQPEIARILSMRDAEQQDPLNAILKPSTDGPAADAAPVGG